MDGSDNKRQMLEELLSNGMVLVTIDATQPDVSVPTGYNEDPQLRLNLSYRFGLPMEVSDWGIEATLTFSGSKYACRLPWSCIYLMVSHVTGRPVLFPEDAPDSLLDFFEEQLKPEISQDTKPKLQVIDNSASEDSDEPEEPPPNPEKKIPGTFESGQIMNSSSWWEANITIPNKHIESFGSALVEHGALGVHEISQDQLVGYFDATLTRERISDVCQKALSEVPGALIPYLAIEKNSATTDWKESWKESFPPQDIGEKLRVVAPWHTAEADNRIPIVIDPGLAFGTGQHPTTAMSLKILEDISRRHSIRHTLDVGCGTGVLGIAAAKLGATHVVATDIDPEACQATEQNAQLNGVRDCMTISQDTFPDRHRYNVIVANILLNTLTELASALIERLAPDGFLIASGLLVEQKQECIGAFKEAATQLDKALDVTTLEQDGEWIAFACSVSDIPKLR